MSERYNTIRHNLQQFGTSGQQVSSTGGRTEDSNGRNSMSENITDIARGSAFLRRMAFRQFSFPRVIPGIVESLCLASAFVVAGIVSLGIPIVAMLGPMVPVVLMMMLCMVASGVYREDINHSIVNLYVHSAYGFVLAAIGFLVVTLLLPVEFSQPKFYFFFLFFSFFVTNTIRPLMSGTDFMDGGGRRGN